MAKIKTFILGPGQLVFFCIVVLVVLVIGGRFDLRWDERWTLGSILGLVFSCFVYYLAISQASYAFFFGLFIATILFTLGTTLHNPLLHFLEGLLVATVLVRADLERVPQRLYDRLHRLDRIFAKVMLIRPPSAEEQKADPDSDKSVRILHYVDYPQLIGFVATAAFYPFASRYFDPLTAKNFLAGAYAFQLVSASIALTFIQWDIESPKPI